MAASRLRRTVAAFVILLSFAAGSRKSSWSEWLHEGCEMDLLADFLHFGTSVFLLHVGLEQCEVWGVKSAV